MQGGSLCTFSDAKHLLIRLNSIEYITEIILLCDVQIKIDPTFHQVGKHLLPVGSNLISVDKDGKVKFNSKTT